MERTISEVIAWIILLIVMGAPVVTGILNAVKEAEVDNIKPNSDVDVDAEDEEI